MRFPCQYSGSEILQQKSYLGSVNVVHRPSKTHAFCMRHTPFAIFTFKRIGRARVQKKSRLRGSEPEEDFAFYVVFEEGLVIFINNPVSAKFSVMRHRL